MSMKADNAAEILLTMVRITVAQRLCFRLVVSCKSPVMLQLAPGSCEAGAPIK